MLSEYMSEHEKIKESLFGGEFEGPLKNYAFYNLNRDDAYLSDFDALLKSLSVEEVDELCSLIEKEEIDLWLPSPLPNV